MINNRHEYILKILYDNKKEVESMIESTKKRLVERENELIKINAAIEDLENEERDGSNS